MKALSGSTVSAAEELKITVCIRPLRQASRLIRKKFPRKEGTLSAQNRVFQLYFAQEVEARRQILRKGIFVFKRFRGRYGICKRAFCDGIYDAGGRYTHRLIDCNYYVCADGDDTQRTESARNMPQITILNIEGLRDLLK